MKKLFVLIVCVGFLSSSLKAQVDVTINPVGLLFENIRLNIEYGVSQDFGIEGRIAPLFNSSSIGEVNYSSLGLGIGVMGKYYFAPKTSIDGWHVGMYAEGRSNKFEADLDGTIIVPEYTNTRLAIGFYGGYKFVSNKNFVFDIGMGFGRNFVNRSVDANGNVLDGTDFLILQLDYIGKLAIGYRFGGNTSSKSEEEVEVRKRKRRK